MSVQEKFKQGYVHPLTGMRFWNMDRGRQRWVSEEKFQQLREKQRQNTRMWRQKNPEYNRLRVAKWRKEHPEKAKESQRRWRIGNPEGAKKWAKNNPEKRKASLNSWQKRNPQARRKWDKANPKRHQGYAIKYRAKRCLADPSYRMRLIVCSRTSRILAAAGILKKDRSADLLGCSAEKFKAYIEQQFLPGMTWDNHGTYKNGGPMTWHVDHITPLASAKSYEDLKKLFHYTNQQPLWAIHNMKKSDKLVLV